MIKTAYNRRLAKKRVQCLIEALWHEYLDKPTIADAILDRIIPKAHRIELKGKSRRKNQNQLP